MLNYCRQYLIAIFDFGDKMQDLEMLVRELVKVPKECEWVEFKHNKNEPNMIGERISAIANSIAMLNRSNGYIVWGVEDVSQEIVGTTFNPFKEKVKGEELVNWLNHSLSQNAVFEFEEFNVDGKPMVVCIIGPAIQYPVSFNLCEYIRDGSITKKLIDRPQLASRLWNSLNAQQMECMPAVENCTPDRIKSLLSCETILTLLNLPEPTNDSSLMDLLTSNHILYKQDNGLYSITNLGALLFAKDLTAFGSLSRKALRIIRYNGDTKSNIARQSQDMRGYAVGFESNLQTLLMMLPSSEIITTGKAELKEHYSTIVLRELLTNAMIHQDLTVNGMNVSVEVFSNRIEICNPGTILVNKDRLIDAPPKSRNMLISSLMRRMKFCEELGSGWDKVVESCEENAFPTPSVYSDENGTRVLLREPTPFKNMSAEDKIWNCYMHACICFSKGSVMTNSSLRTRFQLDSSNTNQVMISALINTTKEHNLIKILDASSSRKDRKYIPYWA